MALTLVASLDAPSGRVQLNVSNAVGAATHYSIFRTHPSGKVWTVRDANFTPLSGSAGLAYDYELPIGRSCVYQAVAYNNAGVQQGVSSGTQTVDWETQDTWLKDPGLPGRNLIVQVNDPGQEQFDTDVGVNPVIGRPTPIVVTDVRRAAAGTIVLAALAQTDNDALHLITSSGNVLLFQTDPAYDWGNLYIAPSRVTVNRVSPVGSDPTRLWAIDYVEVDPPIGATSGGAPDWQDVENTFATWQDLLNSGLTWLQVAEGQGITEPAGPPATLAWRGA